MTTSVNSGALSPVHKTNGVNSGSEVSPSDEKIASAALLSLNPKAETAKPATTLLGRVQNGFSRSSDPVSELRNAAIEGDADKVRQLLESDHQFTAENYFDAFLYAHQRSHSCVAERLIENDEVRHIDDYYYECLYHFQREDTEAAKAIIEKALDKLPSRDWPSIAFNWAAEHGVKEVVDKFLKECDLNPEWFTSPILSAVLGQQGEMVQLLKGHLDLRNPRICERIKEIPKIALQEDLSEALSYKKDGRAKFLLDNGFDIDQQCMKSYLSDASEWGVTANVEILLKKGIENNFITKDFFGELLLTAAKLGRDGVVKILLQNGHKDEKSWHQAFVAASQRGHAKVVAEFLPVISLKVNNLYLSSVLTAATKKHENVISMGLRHGSRVLGPRVTFAAKLVSFAQSIPGQRLWRLALPTIMNRVFPNIKDWKRLKNGETKEE